jgi:hypothetical protein
VDCAGHSRVVASEAKQSIAPQKEGLLRRFAPRNDGKSRQASAFSQHICSNFINFPPSEDQGAGNAGRPMRPQPCVQSESSRKQVTTVTPETPGIPRAAVLTAYFVLPAAGTEMSA